MRLTAKSRAALVEAIMSDVPKTDYHAQLEQIIKREAFAILPTEIQNLPTDLINAFVRRNYLNYTLGSGLHLSMWLPGDREETLPKILREKLRGTADFTRLCEEDRRQYTSLVEIRTEVKQAIESCSTDKQVWERYPEFAKYLPTVSDVPNLPTVSIIGHLKAVGWKE